MEFTQGHTHTSETAAVELDSTAHSRTNQQATGQFSMRLPARAREKEPELWVHTEHQPGNQCWNKGHVSDLQYLTNQGFHYRYNQTVNLSAGNHKCSFPLVRDRAGREWSSLGLGTAISAGAADLATRLSELLPSSTAKPCILLWNRLASAMQN
ncbi:50S ribosomal protein L14 [Platysternon megacephalum]|uniref:50S ribosomal protein L14 n=1 Tax=Platysternon megacephalum TaxID=55544 RepID=A0A4D9DD29_9SAUR|nr:50S ribosomal protein L14 [Platysternon megacephalum]